MHGPSYSQGEGAKTGPEGVSCCCYLSIPVAMFVQRGLPTASAYHERRNRVTGSLKVQRRCPFRYKFANLNEPCQSHSKCARASNHSRMVYIGHEYIPPPPLFTYPDPCCMRCQHRGWLKCRRKAKQRKSCHDGPVAPTRRAAVAQCCGHFPMNRTAEARKIPPPVTVT